MNNNYKESPLASLFVLTYNHADFIKETLSGVLSQDYDNLEIIVSDDNSPDNTFEMIKKIAEDYKGPHKLVINRNEENLGIASHFNFVVQNLCHGEYILPTGGDDICLPDRVSKSMEMMEKFPVDCMAFNMIYINQDSEEIGKMDVDMHDDDVSIFTINDYLSGNCKSSGASRVFRKSLFNSFGPLNSDCPTEDTTMLFRSILRNGAGFCGHVVLKYRKHQNNISGQHNLMTRIDPQLIFNQYDKDLKTACKSNYIDDVYYDKIKKHIKHYLRYNIAIRKLYVQDSKMAKVKTILKLLAENKITLREVFSFTSSLLKRH